MRVIIWLAGLVFVIAAAAALFAWSGAYNVAADEPHGSLTARALKATRARSVEVRAAGIDVPDLEREEMIRAGAGNYDAMCAGCHLRPGLDGTPQSLGLNPAPPDLGHQGIDDPSVAFWTIKHGIRMTGMPAWGSHMEDEYIWGVVAFLRKLPAMTPEDYRELVDASGGHSHGEAGAEESPADKAKSHVHVDEGESHLSH